LRSNFSAIFIDYTTSSQVNFMREFYPVVKINFIMFL